MLDFAKLSDPQYQAQVRAEAKAKSDKLAEQAALQKNAVHACLEHIEELADKERGLVRSCHQKLSTYGVLSEGQEKWLFDIAKRFAQGD